MTRTPAEETQDYIDAHYVTRHTIAERAGVSVSRLLELIEARCTPPHAYEVQRSITCISSFGSYELPGSVEHYYHPRHADWVARAEALSRSMSLEDVANEVRARFADDVLVALDGRPLPWQDGIDLVWDYLMDGTWSLCLKNYDVPGLVQKELARRVIKDIEAAVQGRDPTPDERRRLQSAIASFEDVALPFSPHEVAESSRCLEVNAAIRKFGLEINPAAE